MPDHELADLIDRAVKDIGAYLTLRNSRKRAVAITTMRPLVFGSPDEASKIKQIEAACKRETDAGNDVCRSVRLLLPELDSRDGDSIPLRKALHFIAGGGGPDNVYPLWPDAKASLQMFADGLRAVVTQPVTAGLPAGANEAEGAGDTGQGRGRPRRTDKRKAKQAEIAANWKRFHESKCWKDEPGTPKAQFCGTEGISREELDTALRRNSEWKNKAKSAKKESKVGGK